MSNPPGRKARLHKGLTMLQKTLDLITACLALQGEVLSRNTHNGHVIAYWEFVVGRAQ